MRPMRKYVAVCPGLSILAVVVFMCLVMRFVQDYSLAGPSGSGP